MKKNGENMMKATQIPLGALVLAALLFGCVDNRATFFVRDNKVPDEECIVQSDRNARSLFFGILDVGVRTNWYMFPSFENAMTESLKLNPVTAESNRIQVSGAQVRLALDTGESLGDDFFVPFSGIVEPGGTGVTSFMAIPSGYVTDAYIGAAVIVEMRILGTTLGGIDVDTPWFSFPVYVCRCCLVDFSDAWDDEADTYNCNNPTREPEKVCAAGQDEPVDCAYCATYSSCCNYPPS